MLDVLTAFNLTALFDGPPLSPTGNRHENSFVASRLVPFATHFTTQVLNCPAKSPSKQIRFIVCVSLIPFRTSSRKLTHRSNDAVVPINGSHAGCPADKDGLCSFDNVVSVLKKRSAEIDYQYDCLGNYTASPGMNYNGRAPRS